MSIFIGNIIFSPAFNILLRKITEVCSFDVVYTCMYHGTMAIVVNNLVPIIKNSYESEFKLFYLKFTIICSWIRVRWNRWFTVRHCLKEWKQRESRIMAVLYSKYFFSWIKVASFYTCVSLKYRLNEDPLHLSPFNFAQAENSRNILNICM